MSHCIDDTNDGLTHGIGNPEYRIFSPSGPVPSSVTESPR